jgi:site-specific DNA-adenine methylase
LWSYYGSKSKIVNKYPSPIFDKIIEPFAGTAKYAYKYWEKEVELYDLFPDIINIWNYLKNAKPEDILQLPDVSYKEDIRKYTQLCEEERLLIGYCINRGSASRRNIAQKFNSWNTDKIRIANDLFKIKHWKIILG